ncbi:MAG: PucR family transcriptional regulator [Firmicutes bacterium]|nr:PucR family transcriptional regulator [Bacillota bacterium]
MGVTIADLLQLPSMRKARVVAGRGGLEKIVSSISVLDSVDSLEFNYPPNPENGFYGGEIVISAFVDIADDVEAQCRSLRHLAESGEAGLILCYVGVFLKDIDPRLILLADELDFPLICMPRNRTDLRYGEVIYEVMEAIFKDHYSGGSLVLDILEGVSRLPQHQQTVNAVLKILSNKIRASVILTDREGNVLNEATWPRSLRGLHVHLKGAHLPQAGAKAVDFPPLPGSYLSRAKIHSEGSLGMELFLLREGKPLTTGMLQQAVELVQLAVSLWSQQHDKVVITELVKAIMGDEPIKMRRLADLFQIDVASIHAMWIVEPTEGRGDFPPALLDAVRELTGRYCQTFFADVYEGYLVIFMDGPALLQDMETLRESILKQLPQDVTLTMFRNLQDTTAVREAFLSNRNFVADAKKIFPRRTCFSGKEISFAKTCRRLIERGEASCAKALSPLSPLKRKRGSDDLKETLAVYLLDTDSSIAQTAERLFLHPNTIKYRLKCLSDYLGYRIGTMPASLDLYQALAIDRLLMAEKMAQ